MKIGSILLSGLLVLAVCASPARGDGKVFPPVGVARAETPSQRALIHWRDGIETLVVETTVRSEATNLAWVLPLPSKPSSVLPVDPGLFPTLQTLFQPRVIYRTSWAWLGGAAVVVTTLVWRWGLQRKIPIRFVDVLAVLGVLVVFASMLLPSLGKSKASIDPTVGRTRHEKVHVLSEVHAGIFDVATLAATRAEDLAAWLRRRGFSVPDPSTSVVQDYLDRGWVFVAARVRNPHPGILSPIHPLAFRFPVQDPVYPMRLTGVGTDSLDCDLYVFGPGRAEAVDWKVRYCGVPDFSIRRAPATGPFPLRIRHPELAALVADSAAATKLTARLSSAGFSEDVVLRWRPIRPVGQTLSTWNVALSGSLFYGTWILAVVAAVGWMPGYGQPGPKPWFSRLDRAGAGLAVAAVLVGFLLTPRVPAAQVGTIQRRELSDAKVACLLLAIEASDLPAVRSVLSLSQAADRSNAVSSARAAIAEMLRTHTNWIQVTGSDRPPRNPFTGEPLRMETSSGHLNLEVTDSGLDLVWYDFDGVPAHRYDLPRFDVGTFPPKPSPAPKADR